MQIYQQVNGQKRGIPQLKLQKTVCVMKEREVLEIFLYQG